MVFNKSKNEISLEIQEMITRGKDGLTKSQLIDLYQIIEKFLKNK